MKIRRFIFANYWWIAVLVSVLIVALWWNGSLGVDAQAPLTLLGGVLSAVFFIQKQNLEERRLFRNLFKEFNERYDHINNDLESLVTGTYNGNDHKKIADYFNLCAEEYWWYREGYIPDAVSGNWCRGMLFYLEKGPFSELWIKEQANDSYYGLTLGLIKSGGTLH